MGIVYDFVDGNKKVQLKIFSHFDKFRYVKGDDITKELDDDLRPLNGTYFCIAIDHDHQFAHVENGVFVGIDNDIKFPLFDCYGRYYTERTWELLMKRKKESK